MSIGYGKGKNKARNAVNQALDHPLLEEISIEQAAGIIANFTGGDDLTLHEVSEVLNQLHLQVGDQSEIVFGLSNDERLDGRAQVILVITGLGAPTLEETIPGITLELKDCSDDPPIEPDIHESYSTTKVEPAEAFAIDLPQSAASNIDIPAFLRRRNR